MLTFTQKKPPNPDAAVISTLYLTAEERTRSRYRLEMEDEQVVFLRLPRGTVLRDGDLLVDETIGSLVRITAKPEPVLTVIAKTTIDLLKAAYHLGNRHVAVEITPTYLRLSPDPVLQTMLEQLGVEIKEEISPFQPEAGAYGHNHS
ncbi:urease accessory protein E [Fischerella sp. NIES-4106]|nr:urease accessory protein E [Fischerella sp. NIES-4106]